VRSFIGEERKGGKEDRDETDEFAGEGGSARSENGIGFVPQNRFLSVATGPRGGRRGEIGVAGCNMSDSCYIGLLGWALSHLA
jgi:hypothetical protein